MKRGFTLIELLIVIGILAILAVAVVLVLNPAELLAQARDSQRLSNLSSLKSSVAFYLSTVNSPDVTNGAGARVGRCMVGTTSPFTQACTNVTSTLVTGVGWVTVNLNAIQGGSPIAALPIDPSNTTTYFYAWAGTPPTDATNANVFELDARLESQKFRGQMATDGGNQNLCTTYTEATCFYESGTLLTL